MTSDISLALLWGSTEARCSLLPVRERLAAKRQEVRKRETVSKKKKSRREFRFCLSVARRKPLRTLGLATFYSSVPLSLCGSVPEHLDLSEDRRSSYRFGVCCTVGPHGGAPGLCCSVNAPATFFLSSFRVRHHPFISFPSRDFQLLHHLDVHKSSSRRP